MQLGIDDYTIVFLALKTMLYLVDYNLNKHESFRGTI